MERNQKIIDIIERFMNLSELHKQLYLSHLIGQFKDSEIKELEGHLTYLENKNKKTDIKID